MTLIYLASVTTRLKLVNPQSYRAEKALQYVICEVATTCASR